MNLIHKYICAILGVLLACCFFFTKNLNNKYDKVIMAEGHGYYVYLPAAYIYHDYTFEFFNEVSKKYYYPSYNPPTRNFINEFDGLRVNKYFPGVSLLWLPFFLLAHLLALLFHFPADGYSDIYQYAIGIAGIFYNWLGLKFTKKILTHFKIPPRIQVIVLTSILFGTNMLLYAAAWSSQTHCYSFFLISAFFWFIIRVTDEQYENKNSALGLCFIFLAGIITLRPQNVGILLLLPLFGLNKKKFILFIRQNLISKKGIAGILAALFIIGRVCWYWYMQTGKIFLNPYHGESYILNQPHVPEVLFSFRKGWVLYSPFIAFGLAGIFCFRKTADKLNSFLFWALFIYISSCWWCWAYSSTSFGQRIYIDFYALIALQAALFFNYLYKHKLKWVVYLSTVLVVALNLLQTYQYKNGIIPGEYGTAETYWGNFFITHPISFYPVPKSSIINKEEFFFSFDESTDPAWTDKFTFSGKGAEFLDGGNRTTARKYFRLPVFMSPGENSIVRTTAMIYSSSALGNETLSLDFIKNGAVTNSTFYTGEFLRKKKWTKFQVGKEIPDNVSPGDSVCIYFKLPTGVDSTYIDDLKVEFIHTDKSYEFTRR